MRPTILLATLLALAPAPPGLADVTEAIFEIHATLRGRDYLSPWNPGSAWTVEGSGFLIAPGRIVTNAHMVSDATYVEVRRHGEAERIEARVAFVAHEADLALLELIPTGRYPDVAPLVLGPLPKARDTVTVYGFPMGGDTLSITQGVVSRIEHQAYVHSGRRLLAGQIDAAINPGNSGGPVVMDGQVVGVAMQGFEGADNIGYMIPSTIVRHVLDDVKDGRYDGFPVLGVEFQGLENQDLRRKYVVPAGRTGVLVQAVSAGASADGHLRRGDVLLSVAGHAIADNGSAEFRARERTDLAYYVQELPVGSTLSLEVLRAGKLLHVNVPLKAGSADGRVARQEFDRAPRYFVYAGLVFLPLTSNALQQFGGNWQRDAPRGLVAAAERRAASPAEELVFLSRTLAAPLNDGYEDLSDHLVLLVDGQMPRDFAHFVELIDNGTAPFVTIQLDRDAEIALERSRVRTEGKAVLERYGIASDRALGVPR